MCGYGDVGRTLCEELALSGVLGDGHGLPSGTAHDPASDSGEGAMDEVQAEGEGVGDKRGVSSGLVALELNPARVSEAALQNDRCHVPLRGSTTAPPRSPNLTPHPHRDSHPRCRVLFGDGASADLLRAAGVQAPRAIVITYLGRLCFSKTTSHFIAHTRALNLNLHHPDPPPGTAATRAAWTPPTGCERPSRPHRSIAAPALS